MALINLISTLNCLQRKKHLTFTYPKSKIVLEFLNLLWREGLISGFTVTDGVQISLKYTNNAPAFKKILICSKPGHKKFKSINKVSQFNPNRISIVSNSDGLFSSLKSTGLKICEIEL